MNDFAAVEDAEPLVADVLAVREFVYKSGELVGLTYMQPLLPGINEAQCPGGKHSAPQADHSCGFYAYDDSAKRFAGLDVGWDTNGIAAVVRLSGKLVICEGGMRAERMELIAVTSPNSALSTEVAAKFSVPCFADREFMLAEFPVEKVQRPEQEPSKIEKIGEKVSPVTSRLRKAKSFLDRHGVTHAITKALLYGMVVALFLYFLYFQTQLYGSEGINALGPIASVFALIIIAQVRSIIIQSLIVAATFISLANLDAEYFESLPEDVGKFITVLLVQILTFSLAYIVMLFLGASSPARNNSAMTAASVGAGGAAGIGTTSKAGVARPSNRASMNLRAALNVANRRLPSRAYTPKGGDNDGESREGTEGS